MKFPAFETSVSAQQDDCILIDWLTVTCHGFTPEDALDLLGMSHCPFELTKRFMNGYPCRLYWNGINILYGADDPSYMPSPDLVRDDMGICINLSGTGCRAFETYGRNDWKFLFHTFFTFTKKVREKNGRKFSFNVTRLDISFDDHSGIFDIYLIADKVRNREYVSPSKFSQITWSDNQESDIQGICVNIGSAASDILFRIYDKAAERGFSDRHWIRLEAQLRGDRATAAVRYLLDQDTGVVLKGICNQYLRFVEPSSDTNKSRWCTSDFWSSFISCIEAIQLWISPGSEYNISKSEFYLKRQYGQILVTFSEIYDDSYILDQVKSLYPLDRLDKKYRQIIETFKLGALYNENV